MNRKQHSYTTHAPFSSDQRISHIDPNHLAQLSEYARQLSEAPKEQKLEVFLSIQKEASHNNILFSDDDKTLLLQVLTEQMTAEEKKRVDLLCKLAAKLNTFSG